MSASDAAPAKSTDAAQGTVTQEQKALSLAARAGTDGLWYIDFVTGEAYLSPRLLELLGFTRGEMGDPLPTYENVLLHPDDRPRWTAAWDAHLVRHAPFDLELRLLTKTRGYRWFWHRGQAAWGDDGRPARMAGSISDVTERHEALEALQASEHRFTMLAESIHEAFWLAEVDPFRVLYVSPGFARVWGIPGDAFQADPFVVVDLVHPDDRALVVKTFSNLKEPSIRALEFRIRRPDGEECWLHARTFPVRGPSDGSRLVSAIASDVTPRKRAEAALRESEQRYRAMLAAYAEGSVFLFDRDLRFMLAEGQVLTDLKRSPSEFIGRRLDEIVGSEVAADLEPIYRATLAGEERQYTIERPGGRLYDSRVIPLRDSDGHVFAGMLISRDITEARRHHQVREVLEAQLRQAQKMEAVGQLAGGVAHDFNNLLTVIAAHTHFLLNALGADDPGREDARAIAEATTRAAALTRQLLAFSRKQIMTPAVLDLNHVVEESQKLFTRLLGEDVEIETSLASDLGDVVADPGQLAQVLMNLAVNARDAMPHGGVLTLVTTNVTLTSDTRASDSLMPAGDYVRLEVRDTGTGIDAATQMRLFEPFFTTKEVGKGTGLGLATVYGIIKQSNGYIIVESKPGYGASFQIYLPRATAEQRGELIRSGDHGATHGVETLLVVEDEPAVREIATRALRGQGYVVLEASNGPDALALARRYAAPIDMVVSDVVMPQMGGAELVRQLTEARPGIRVLFMSGYTDDEVVRRGVFSANTAVLQKPFVPSDLARVVRDVLDRAHPS